MSLPQGATGVWTIGATSMAGLITDPRDEVTVHIDQYSGDVRGVITWDDYSLPAKGMAAGVPLHQGSFGAWNLWAAVVVCIAVLGLAATGVATWWLRRPSRAGRLVAPRSTDGVGQPDTESRSFAPVGPAHSKMLTTRHRLALDMVVHGPDHFGRATRGNPVRPLRAIPELTPQL